MPKTAKYREFLGCCASIEAGEEQPSTGRYIRVYVGPKRQGAEYLEQYDLHFDAGEVSEGDIDARLWPVVSAVCRAYTGWVYLELVEASEGYRVIKRARVAQATGEELEEEEDAADGSALASLRTAWPCWELGEIRARGAGRSAMGGPPGKFTGTLPDRGGPLQGRL